MTTAGPSLPSRCVSLQHSLLARWRSLTGLERKAWVVALVVYVGLDSTLTAVGIQLGAVERNVAAVALMDAFGLWGGIVFGKLVSVALLYVGWRLFPWWADWIVEHSNTNADPWDARYVYPLTLAVWGAAVAVVNAHVVAVHAGLL